jgi:hypothetical protein
LRMATDDDSESQMRRATSDGSGDGCGRRPAAVVAAARFREEQRCGILRVLCGFLIFSAGFSRSQILGHQSLAAGPHGPQTMFLRGGLRVPIMTRPACTWGGVLANTPPS